MMREGAGCRGIRRGCYFEGERAVTRQRNLGAHLHRAREAQVCVGLVKLQPDAVVCRLHYPPNLLTGADRTAVQGMPAQPLGGHLIGLPRQREPAMGDPVGEAPDQRAKIRHRAEIGLEGRGAQKTSGWSMPSFRRSCTVAPKVNTRLERPPPAMVMR